jgi:hypothetical protein
MLLAQQYQGFTSPNKGFAKQRPGLAKCGGVRIPLAL